MFALEADGCIDRPRSADADWLEVYLLVHLKRQLRGVKPYA